MTHENLASASVLEKSIIPYHLTLTPAEHQIAVEESATHRLTIKNHTQDSLKLRLSSEGIHEHWLWISPRQLYLPAGTAAQVNVVISPPQHQAPQTTVYTWQVVADCEQPSYRAVAHAKLTLLSQKSPRAALTLSAPPSTLATNWETRQRVGGGRAVRGRILVGSSIALLSLFLLALMWQLIVQPSTAPSTTLLPITRSEPSLLVTPLESEAVIIDQEWSAPLPTPTFIPTMTLIPSVTPSKTPTPSFTPSLTPIPSLTPTPAPASATPSKIPPSPTPDIPLPEPDMRAVISEVEEPLPPPASGVLSEEEWTYERMFQYVGTEYDIDWRILASLAYRESRLDPLAVGKDGERGLMQILPSTWDEFAPQVGVTDPFDAYSSTRVGAAYLAYVRRALVTQGYTEAYWMLVAYNWGPNNMNKLIQQQGNWGDVPVIRQNYVYDILDEIASPTSYLWTHALKQPVLIDE